MLHLARCIAFGVDIADFLKLKRAFQRQGIIRPTAKVEHIPRRCDMVRHIRNLLIMRQSGIEGGWRFNEVVNNIPLFISAQTSLHHRQMGGQRSEHRQLAGKGLGRGHAYFRPGMGGQQQIRLARHGTGRHIDDNRNLLPLRPRVAECC